MTISDSASCSSDSIRTPVSKTAPRSLSAAIIARLIACEPPSATGQP